MPILQGMCSSFKQESWLGIHDLDTDTLKMALYTATADLSQATTAYNVSTAGQVPSGSGYTTGGETITGAQVLLSGTTAYLTFNNPVWSGASFTCRGALIYNSSKADRAIAVLDFGSDKIASGTFTVQLPAATASTALLRFA
jgi:hypothetical protein